MDWHLTSNCTEGCRGHTQIAVLNIYSACMCMHTQHKGLGVTTYRGKLRQPNALVLKNEQQELKIAWIQLRFPKSVIYHNLQIPVFQIVPS